MEKMSGRIKDLRGRLGLNQTQFGVLLQVSQPTVSRWEAGEDLPEGENLARLARLSNTSVEEFAGYAPSPELTLKIVTVVGAVQAGVWVDAMEWPLSDQFDVTWSPDGVWDQYRKFGLKVRGNSMNKFYPEGSVVICVSFYDLGERDPRPGERVVVYRRQNDMIEATLKEFLVQDGRAWLWPRSDDPAFQAPLEFKRDSGPLHDNGTEIFALVIGSYTAEAVRP